MVAVIIEREEQSARANSYAIARFALTQISKKAKIDLDYFLPYSAPSEGGKDGIQPSTAKVLRGLVKGRALPARVDAAAIRALGGLGDG